MNNGVTLSIVALTMTPAAFAGGAPLGDPPASCIVLLGNPLQDHALDPGPPVPPGASGVRLFCLDGEGTWEGGGELALDAGWLQRVIGVCFPGDVADDSKPFAAAAAGQAVGVACVGFRGDCGPGDASVCPSPLDAPKAVPPDPTGPLPDEIVLLLEEIARRLEPPWCAGDWVQTYCYYHDPGRRFCILWAYGWCRVPA